METEAEILAGLDADQRAAVLHAGSPLLVDAAAGAGKTTTLVCRMVHLAAVRGVLPMRIFATTFSRKAAREMNERLAAAGHGAVEVRTFHAFARRVLGEHVAGFRDAALDETGRRYRMLLADAAGYRHLKLPRVDLDEVERFVELAKAAGLGAGDPPLELARHARRTCRVTAAADAVRVFELAERLRREGNLWTFADTLVAARDLLREPGTRARWAGRFDAVLVDELQDTSAVQHELVDALAAGHRELTGCGDLRQCLYGFRGARPDLFRGFAARWGARTVHLATNYRCPTRVVDAANAVGAGGADAVPMRASRPDAGSVRYVGAATPEAEADDVARELAAARDAGGRWSDAVVLYRASSVSRAVEEALVRARIPHRVVGGCGFYARREVVDLLAYARVAWRAGATMDDVRRCLFAPQRYLGHAFAEAIERASTGGHGSFLATIQAACGLANRLTGSQRAAALAWGGLVQGLRDDIAAGDERARPDRLLKRALDETRYVDHLKRNEGAGSPDEDRAANLAELVRVAAAFGTVGDLLDHAHVQTARAGAVRKDDGADAVTLMSVHAAKGLEFPHVYLVGCRAGMMPHALSDDADEERRIYYVAVTRARETLRVSYPRFANGYACDPSPFAAGFPRPGAADARLAAVDAYGDPVDEEGNPLDPRDPENWSRLYGEDGEDRDKASPARGRLRLVR